MRDGPVAGYLPHKQSVGGAIPPPAIFLSKQMEAFCKNCKFWSSGIDPDLDSSDDDWRFCKRYPPTITSMAPAHPETHAEDFCGEFKEKNTLID